MNAQRGRQDLGRCTQRALAPPRLAAALLTAALAASLAACSGGGSVNIANSQLSDPATADFPIFYVKRQVTRNSDGSWRFASVLGASARSRSEGWRRGGSARPCTSVTSR